MVMIATIDANVLVPGFLNERGVSGQIVTHWLEADFQLAICEHMLAEVERAYHDPYFSRRLSAEQRTAVLEILRRKAILTTLTVPVEDIATHPEDDLVLSTALSAKAQYLVTHDKHVLALRHVQGVAIVSPPQFLSILRTL